MLWAIANANNRSTYKQLFITERCEKRQWCVVLHFLNPIYFCPLKKRMNVRVGRSRKVSVGGWIVSSITRLSASTPTFRTSPSACETWTDLQPTLTHRRAEAVAFSQVSAHPTRTTKSADCESMLNCRGQLFGWAPLFPRTSTDSAALICFDLPRYDKFTSDTMLIFQPWISSHINLLRILSYFTHKVIFFKE